MVQVGLAVWVVLVIQAIQGKKFLRPLSLLASIVPLEPKAYKRKELKKNKEKIVLTLGLFTAPAFLFFLH